MDIFVDFNRSPQSLSYTVTGYGLPNSMLIGYVLINSMLIGYRTPNRYADWLTNLV